MNLNYKDEQKANSCREGSALITVVGLILLMTLAGAIIAAMTGQSAFRVKKTLRSVFGLRSAGPRSIEGMTAVFSDIESSADIIGAVALQDNSRNFSIRYKTLNYRF